MSFEIVPCHSYDIFSRDDNDRLVPTPYTKQMALILISSLYSVWLSNSYVQKLVDNNPKKRHIITSVHFGQVRLFLFSDVLMISCRTLFMECESYGTICRKFLPANRLLSGVIVILCNTHFNRKIGTGFVVGQYIPPKEGNIQIEILLC